MLVSDPPYGVATAHNPKVVSNLLRVRRAPALLTAIGMLAAGPVAGEPVSVRHTEGIVHGFLALRTLEGVALADGDLVQTARGERVTARLVFRFKDGSIHDETAVFSQRKVFRLISDHLVQKGPTFPQPLDMTIDAVKGDVVVRYTDDHGEQKTESEHLDVPPDLANGLILTLLKNVRSDAVPKSLSFVAATPKPRLVQLKVSAGGGERFSTGATARTATRYTLKVDIGGLSGVLAPLLGKQPPDSHVWILGGDRPPVAAMEIWSAMVRGIKEGEGAGGRHLMSYHPMGEQRSSTWFHQAEWLDFNMLQSGHARRANPNYLMIEQDYVLKPPKPCMDGEPCYEDLPVGFTAANQSVFGEHDVRQAAYWAVFAGAHGHTYGCNSIWQMYTKDVAPLVDAHRPWKEALHLPGSFQMRHLRRLIESRPFLSRIPDQSLLTNPPRPMSDHCRATRDGTQRSADATYIMAYTPYVSLIGVRTSAIAGKRLRPWWYDPRTGAAYPQPEVDNSGEYHAPWHTQPWLTQGPDWVLVVDDADKGYAPPGEARST
jgi:hypothetical protein